MLSTYSHRDDNNTSKKWYEFASIIEALQECGYECSWFGNQARRSIKNGTARLYAEACNRQFFLQQEGSDSFNDRYDNVLIDSSFHYINQPNQQHCHRFIIYHMMGSHFDFKMRYPSEYNHFKEDDYALEPIGHRTILATYDNSILYNDYIVSHIMNLFHDKDAVVIYVPDHGQVMYRNQNRPDHYAHGFSKDPISYILGVEIPLIIYASPVFQKQHPDLMLLINSRQEHPKTWNSDDLPYLILDLIGAKTINGEDIQPKSLLN
jgi:heptose-I-phosphate ethanolaminephosphotransferase